MKTFTKSEFIIVRKASKVGPLLSNEEEKHFKSHLELWKEEMMKEGGGLGKIEFSL